jgi:hypothetical protein
VKKKRKDIRTGLALIGANSDKSKKCYQNFNMHNFYFRMGLTSIPTFSGEEKVRLLSLQHNLIAKLEGTMSLPRLVFLDLYDNQVEKIAGLQELPNVKVLLLGKNR